MNNAKNTSITFGASCAINDDMLYVSSFIDALPHDTDYTRMFVLNLKLPGTWFYHDIPDKTVTSVAMRHASSEVPRATYALCSDGTIEIYNSTAVITETIPIHKNAGGMSSITHIDDKVYACGAGNQIYCRDSDTWIETAQNLREQAQNIVNSIIEKISSKQEINIIELTGTARTLTSLECIKGTHDDNVYACGTNGTVLHWDGLEWQTVHSGTRQHLHDIHCVTADDIIMCGHNGVVIRGNHRIGFKRLLIEKTDVNFWSVRLFNQTLYLGSTSGLFNVHEKNLVKTRFDSLALPSHISIESMDATDQTLWVVTTTFVLRLNSNAWELIEHPDNVPL